MISIIISSYIPSYYEAIEKNIAETCGVPFEIIQIKNPNLMGICEAYNLGAKKAKYENFLFLHEDTEFSTVNWGSILIKTLQIKGCGIVGIVGSNYVPNVPFAWWDLYENNFSHYIQYDGEKLIGDYNLDEDINVNVVDGVFMAVKRSIFQEYEFNENISGYHGYDLEFSINVANSYQNIISSKIKLAHFSYAVNTLNKHWLDSMIDCRQFYSIPKNQIVDKKRELFSFLKMYEYLKKFNYKKKDVVFLLVKYSNFSKIGLNGLRRSLNILLSELRT